jgi:DNA-binding IclR family transcriptional regulator
MGRNPSKDSQYSEVLTAVAESECGLTLRDIQKKTGIELNTVGRIVHYFYFTVQFFQRTGERFAYRYSVNPARKEDIARRLEGNEQ